MVCRGTLLGLLMVVPVVFSPPQGDRPAVRFVRVEIPGEERILSLAEVQVIRNGRNLALGGAARQSSVDHGGAAVRAIDGNWDGTYQNASVTHTRAETNPWWELDLLRAQPIDQVTLWPRTDSNWDRLAGYRLELLDENRNVVWSAVDQPAPRTRVDFSPWGASVVHPRPAVELRQKQRLAIDDAIDRGVDWLLASQQRDGSWGGNEGGHGSGQTALSLYTLVKSGVPRTAPALVRGFAYLRANPPPTTYGVSCALMAFAALGAADDRETMQSLLDTLVDWQTGRDGRGTYIGTWAYPYGAEDLSNTQFAILGLRAARMAKLTVPRKVWLEALEGVLLHQETPYEVDGAAPGPRSRTGRRRIAGFGYHTRPGPRNTSGSMTAAGLSSLVICEWGVGGKLPRKLRERVEVAKGLGFAWLEHHFQVGGNPNLEAWWSRHDYYLYGLERVGALFGIDLIGTHDWYWEGAWNFIGRQGAAGAWGGEATTCFALLFLSRATAVSSGATARRRENVYISEAEDVDVHWRVTGSNPVTMFVTGFAAQALEDYSDPEGIVKGLRVERVDYLADGEVIGTVAGDPGRGWTNERFALAHRFERGGTVELDVRVYVIDPAAASAAQATTVLLADGLEVSLGERLEDWMLDYAVQGARNLLRRARPRVSVSSKLDDGRAGAKAVDGLHSTAWIAAAADREPTLTLEFERAVRADRLLFSPVSRNSFDRGAFDRATRVEVLVNRRKEPYVVELPADDRRKGTLVLSKPLNLRRIEIKIVARARGERNPGQVGFAEVEVLLGP